MRETEPRRELFRAGNLSVGRLDEKNYYTATVRLAGPDSKEPGSEVLAAKTFHPTLAAACREGALRTADEAAARTLAEYAARLEEIVGRIAVVLQNPNGAQQQTREGVAAPQVMSGAGRRLETPPPRQGRSRISSSPHVEGIAGAAQSIARPQEVSEGQPAPGGGF